MKSLSGGLVLILWTICTSSLIEARSKATTLPGWKSCPEGYELSINPVSGKSECNCRAYHLYWPQDGLCYRELTQGPCPTGFKLVWNVLDEKVECQCPPFWSQADDGQCYEEYSQGPCLSGQLFIASQCVCNSNLTMHYYEEKQECYQLYTQGPCSKGQMMTFNYHTRKPQCVCRDEHVLNHDGNCYQVNTVGPCNQTACPQDTPVSCFVNDVDSADADCVCLSANSQLDGGRCYQPYNQGPCEYGHWLVYSNNEQPKCLRKKDCQRFDNWYFYQPDGNCYKQLRQGPCALGELFYLDPETAVTSCECRTSWSKHFYPPHNKCYEQNSVGPCPAGQYFSFNESSQTTGCSCFTNFVADPQRQICVEKLTADTCPEGTLVTADPINGNMRCDCNEQMKEHFWTDDGRCYQHFTAGPCAAPNIFRIDDVTGLPACMLPFNHRQRRYSI